jgi:hypothetical protein
MYFYFIFMNALATKRLYECKMLNGTFCILCVPMLQKLITVPNSLSLSIGNVLNSLFSVRDILIFCQDFDKIRDPAV